MFLPHHDAGSTCVAIQVREGFGRGIGTRIGCVSIRGVSVSGICVGGIGGIGTGIETARSEGWVLVPAPRLPVSA